MGFTRCTKTSTQPTLHPPFSEVLRHPHVPPHVVMDFSESMPFLTCDDMELLSSPSARPGAPHRRVRSDPTEIMKALRSERIQWGGSLNVGAPAGKRDLSPMADESSAPAGKRHAPAPRDAESTEVLGYPPLFSDRGGGENCMAAMPSNPDLGFDDAADATEGGAAAKGSKKDVPMWTVEEDLLILQLVERHGKRWSKIAAHLPGRTDNGVRNRWNRMERAQVLRQRRGPDAGYRCRRCGQPKRGHICAALTLGDTPAGEELHQKAEALSRLSAHRMRPPSATSEATTVPAETEGGTPKLAPERAPSPPVTALPVAFKAEPTPAALIASVAPAAVPAAAPELPSNVAPAGTLSGFDEIMLDDFLDELQLHEYVKQPSLFGPPSDAMPPALLSQASLNGLLMTLAGPEGVHCASPQKPHGHVLGHGSPLIVF